MDMTQSSRIQAIEPVSLMSENIESKGDQVYDFEISLLTNCMIDETATKIVVQ